MPEDDIAITVRDSCVAVVSAQTDDQGHFSVALTLIGHVDVNQGARTFDGKIAVSINSHVPHEMMAVILRTLSPMGANATATFVFDGVCQIPAVATETAAVTASSLVKVGLNFI